MMWTRQQTKAKATAASMKMGFMEIVDGQIRLIRAARMTAAAEICSDGVRVSITARFCPSLKHMRRSEINMSYLVQASSTGHATNARLACMRCGPCGSHGRARQIHVSFSDSVLAATEGPSTGEANR